jgi:hypothetical protein
MVTEKPANLVITETTGEFSSSYFSSFLQLLSQIYSFLLWHFSNNIIYLFCWCLPSAVFAMVIWWWRFTIYIQELTISHYCSIWMGWAGREVLAVGIYMTLLIHRDGNYKLTFIIWWRKTQVDMVVVGRHDKIALHYQIMQLFVFMNRNSKGAIWLIYFNKRIYYNCNFKHSFSC